ncbi:MAG: potassium channel family protein [Ilumatobacteraceae bacterium]
MAKNEDLYMTEELRRWRARTDVPFLIVAIASIPFLLLELIADRLPDADNSLLLVVNIVVLAVFGTDYVMEFRAASNKAAYFRSEWTSLVIVLSQVMAVVPALVGFGFLRVLRILRLGTIIARFFAIGEEVENSGRQVLRKHAAKFAFGLAFMTWIMSAAAFTLAEDVGDGRRVHSFFDALWWSSATITTVGYGDIFPVTAAGRVVGVFTMLVGISTFSVVTAKAAQFLLKVEEEEKARTQSGGS